MGIIDFILNLAGLLLWINWRSILFDPFEKRTPATLVGALKRAAPTRFRHWHLLAAIGALIVFRALFYWQVGATSNPVWSGKLDLAVTTPAFLSSSISRIFLFSIFSFARTLGIFYIWLFLLSILSGPMPIHRLVKIQIGAMDKWPRAVKLFLPFIVAVISWWLASWPLAWLQIIPKPVSPVHRIEESVVIGAGVYLAWKFLLAAILALHLLGSYIYFGNHPFWKYVDATAETILKPLEKIPLRAGKVDFAPVAGIAAVFLLAELAGHGLSWLYTRFQL